MSSKPVAEGSSFGVLIVREGRRTRLQQLFADDWGFGDTVMVERYIGGRELTCGVMGDEPLDIIELVTADGGWYDYDAKYSENGARHVIPAPLLPEIYQSIRNLALRAHRALGVAASAGRTSDTTIGRAARASSSASKSIRNRA